MIVKNIISQTVIAKTSRGFLRTDKNKHFSQKSDLNLDDFSLFIVSVRSDMIPFR